MGVSSEAQRARLIPGDGIGPEVTEAALAVIEAAGVDIAWDRVEAGAEVVAKYGTPMPDEALNSIRSTGVALKGPIGTPVGVGFRIAKAVDAALADKANHTGDLGGSASLERITTAVIQGLAYARKQPSPTASSTNPPQAVQSSARSEP